MALTTITGNMVSVNAIQGTLIADNAITAVHIASNAVTSIQIAENNVTAREIASNSITVAQLADASVESDKIANGVITTNHLNSAMISSQTEVTAVAGDFVLLGDTSDSNNLKKTPVSSIVALAGVADGAITSAKLDTNISISGELTVGSHLNMGDNDNIKLGTGADLQIYHDGTYSSVQHTLGSGALLLRGGAVSITNSVADETMASFASGGAVTLYYAGATKLATTSTGIDVTGTATMDGLTVDGSGTLSGNLLVGAPSASAKLTVGTFGDTARAAQFHGGSILVDGGAASEIIIGDGNVAYMSIQTTDDATAMKIRNFSGSADLVTIERASGDVGIGQSVPAHKLDILTSTDQQIPLRIKNSDADSHTYMRFEDNGGQYWDTGINWANNDYYFNYGGAFRARFTNAGGLQIDGSGASTTPTLALNSTTSTTFNHSINAFNANLAGSENQLIVVGKEGSTKNSGYIGYKWISSGNDGNLLTFGHWSNDNLMNLTANGEFLLNRTGIFGTGNTCTAFIQGKSAAAMYVCGTNTSGYQLITFFNGGLNVMGSITHNNSTVTYGGSSDYRLKENVNYDFDATTRLKQLKPARFNWIADSDNIVQDGFLAHEVSAVVPEAVVGTKDATETVSNAVLNTEGNVVAQDITEEEWTAGKKDSTYDADTTWEASHTKIVQQNLDPAKLVPLLVKTIQELEARITTLENA